jgi:hypothetical protein
VNPRQEHGRLRVSPSDFDAFLEGQARTGDPAERTSAALLRRDLRGRIERWAAGVAARVAQGGVDLEAVVPDELDQHLSSRAPRAISQRVLFLRREFARGRVPFVDPVVDPLRAHAYLALAIDSVHLAVSFELCPEASADVKNLQARLAYAPLLLELLTALEALPDEVAIGVLGVPRFPQANRASADDVRALLELSQRSRRSLWIGWSVHREEALAHADALDRDLSDVLASLAEVYRVVAWAPENDLIGATRRVDARRRRSSKVRAKEERERPRQKREERTTARKTRRQDGEDTRVRAAEPTSIRSPEPRVEAPLPPSRASLAAALRGARKGRSSRRDLAVVAGARVRVLTGAFAGKVGVVEALEPDGRARVRFGLLATTVEAKDLAPATGGRPMLASSHRGVGPKRD